MEAQLSIEGHGLQPIMDVKFDVDRREFILSAGLSGDLGCRISYPFEAIGPGAEEAFIDLFIHPRHAESDVRPVKISGDDSRTAGWLCTIGALVSTEHEHAESKHFRRAAYAAVDSILKNTTHLISAVVGNGTTISLSDLFDCGWSILILHKPTVGNDLDVTCSRILPSMHQCGFLPVADQGIPHPLGEAAIEQFSNMEGGFSLRLTSTQVGFTDFTNQVFRQLLPTANTSLLRFFLYYQMIEAMMAAVFAHRQSNTIGKMQAVSDDPVKVHPLIEKLKEDSSEKKRIRLLFNQYTSNATATSALKEHCNDFLRKCSSDEEELPAHSLYQVRNLLFHGMRSIPASAFQAFDAVVSELTCVVPELLMSFHLPDETSAEVTTRAQSSTAIAT